MKRICVFKRHYESCIKVSQVSSSQLLLNHSSITLIFMLVLICGGVNNSNQHIHIVNLLYFMKSTHIYKYTIC